MEKEKGRQGGLAKPTMQLSESYPVRMKQIPLAMNTVRYVDQTQQILLSETETEEKGANQQSKQENGLQRIPSSSLSPTTVGKNSWWSADAADEAIIADWNVTEQDDL